MILSESVLYAADNAGTQIVKCIKVLGGFWRRHAKLGDKIIITPKKIKYSHKIGKKARDDKDKKIKYIGLIVATKKEKRRRDGLYIKFDKNFILTFDKRLKFLGTRVYGPLCKEIRHSGKEVNYKQIISYSGATI